MLLKKDSRGTEVRIVQNVLLTGGLIWGNGGPTGNSPKRPRRQYWDSNGVWV